MAIACLCAIIREETEWGWINAHELPSGVERQVEDMKRLLILGGSSFLGRAVAMQLPAEDCVATFRCQPAAGGVRFDPLKDDVEDLVDAHGPFSHALLLYGITSPDRCHADPQGSHEVNVDSTTRCLEALVRRQVMPVFASSEVVFDGERGSYVEDDAPNPLMLYGRQKVAVERFCAGLDGPWLVGRLSRVVGTQPGDGTLFTEWVAQLQDGAPIRCATDSRFNPIHVDDAATQLLALMRGRASGLVHVGGAEAATRWEMLHVLIEAWERAGLRSSSEISRCVLSDFATPEPRPRDVSLCVDRMWAITGTRARGMGAMVADCLRKAGLDSAGP